MMIPDHCIRASAGCCNRRAGAASPQMPPSLVPLRVVDLMTPEGSAVFGAQWKSMEAKIVEGPAIANAMPGYKTSYDIQPHAGERGFDDSSWPIIGAKGWPTGVAAAKCPSSGTVRT